MINSPGPGEFLHRRPGRKIVAIIAMVAIGLLLFAAWSAFSGKYSFLRGYEWRVGVRVALAELRSPDSLVLNVDSCNGNPEVVLLREMDVDVQVKVVSGRFPFSGGRDDCADGVEIQLRQPLGDRVLIDKHSGQTVSVMRAVSVLEADLRSPNILVLDVDSCNGIPEIAVRRETDEEVQVLVVLSPARFRGNGDDCQETALVQLQKPLGDRIIVDMNTGQPVAVSVANSSSSTSLPGHEDQLAPDVAPPQINDPPNEAELQDLQRVADQFGISLQEAIDRYAWNDNFSLLVAKIRSEFPGAYADSAIGDAGGAWIAFVGSAPDAALDMIDIFESSHSGVTIEVRTGS
jgi:hypothetical protein